jgi:DNA invertase Pin-like site-specific DNA recombinase
MGQKSPLKKRHAPLLLGYVRVSTADDPQVLDRQRGTLTAAGAAKIYCDTASGKKEDSQGLEACLKALRDGDTLVVCRLDRLCRGSRHVVDLVNTLTERGVHLRVIASLGAAAETLRSRIIQRARGRKGGRKPKMTAAKVNLAMAALASRKTRVAELCDGLGITRQTLYRHVSPAGELRPAGARVLNSDADW